MYTLRNLLRRRQRLALMILGALVIGFGLSYFVAMVAETRWQAQYELERRWQTDYDILVRPPGFVSDIERRHDLVEANYLTGIPGGISFQQLATIRSLRDVELAAPISMLATWNVTAACPADGQAGPGVHRIFKGRVIDAGARRYELWESPLYRIIGLLVERWEAPSWLERGDERLHSTVGFASVVLAAAVDPAAEAAMVGLDRAVVRGGYLSEESRPRVEVESEFGSAVRFPVILNANPLARTEVRNIYESLDLPPTRETIELVNERGGRTYIDSLPATDTVVLSGDSAAVAEGISSVLRGAADTWLFDPAESPPGPLHYELLSGDAADRPPGTGDQLVLVAGPLGVDTEGLDLERSVPEPVFREPLETEEALATFESLGTERHIRPWYIGLYDTELLDIGRDPLTRLPMETYRPAEARLVYDAQGRRLQEPRPVYPTGNPYGLLAPPPLALTTLEAARMMKGDDCISAIRVKVRGVEDMSEESQQRVEAVAKEIQARTGLQVDITIGASPVRQLIYIDGLPAGEGVPEVAPLGYIEAPWIKKGVHISLVREMNAGNAAVLVAVLLVAGTYVLTTTLVGVFGRRRELGILRGLGWRQSSVLASVVGEAMLAGGLAALLGMGLSFFTADWEAARIPYGLVGLIGALAMAVYLFGALGPGIAAGRTAPYQAIRRGELAAAGRGRRAVRDRECGRVSERGGVRHPSALALRALLSRRGRYVLSIACIAVSTGLLVAFVLITVKMRGLLYASVIGEYVALRVGPRHFLTAGLCLMISALAIADLMSLNVTERRGEIALLQALGWRRGSVSALVLWEGAIAGLAGGVCGGLAAAVTLVWALGVTVPAAALWTLLVLVVPVATGIAGAALPARQALQVPAAAGIRYE